MQYVSSSTVTIVEEEQPNGTCTKGLSAIVYCFLGGRRTFGHATCTLQNFQQAKLHSIIAKVRVHLKYPEITLLCLMIVIAIRSM